MSLQHLGINVQDPKAFAAFLSAYFDLRETVHAGRITMLEDDRGFILALAASTSRPVYPPDFHLGFSVTEPELRRIHDALARDGYNPTPIETNHGSLKCFVMAPEEILIEVAVR